MHRLQSLNLHQRIVTALLRLHSSTQKLCRLSILRKDGLFQLGDPLLLKYTLTACMLQSFAAIRFCFRHVFAQTLHCILQGSLPILESLAHHILTSASS